MRISVCIPTIRPTTVGHAVASIRRQRHQDWDLVVVGQGDPAPLREAVEQAAQGDPRVRFLHIEGRGLSRGRNAGHAVTSGEVIAFMDDDCEADEHWLAVLAEEFADGTVGVVCGSVLAPAHREGRFTVCPEVVPAEVGWDPADGEAPAGWAMLGANMAIRDCDARRLQFDECMGAGSSLQGGEDHDYVHRLSTLGVRMRSTPRSIVHHTYGARTGLVAIYRHKRERIRGDGALAAKGTMLEQPSGGVPVRKCVMSLARKLVHEVQLRRLPLNAFRIYHYLASYRECLRRFGISSDRVLDAVLVPRPADASRTRTSPVLAIT